jgi:GTP cyclohydrolase III
MEPDPMTATLYTLRLLDRPDAAVSLTKAVNTELDLQCMPITTGDSCREIWPVDGVYIVTPEEAKGIASRAAAAAEGYRDTGRRSALAARLDQVADDINALLDCCGGTVTSTEDLMAEYLESEAAYDDLHEYMLNFGELLDTRTGEQVTVDTWPDTEEGSAAFAEWVEWRS